MNEPSERPFVGSIPAEHIFADLIPLPILIRLGNTTVKYDAYEDMLRNSFEDVISRIKFSEIQIRALNKRYLALPYASYEIIAGELNVSIDTVLNEINNALKLIHARYPEIVEELLVSWVQRNPQETARSLIFLERQIDELLKERTPVKIDEEFLCLSLKDAGIPLRIANKIRDELGESDTLKEKVLYIIDLVQWTEFEFLKAPYLGKNSLRDVMKILEPHGLKINMILDQELVTRVRAKIAESKLKE